jgi:hypothetical protein
MEETLISLGLTEVHKLTFFACVTAAMLGGVGDAYLRASNFKKVPKYETTADPNSEPREYQTKQSKGERDFWVFSRFFVAFVAGVAVALAVLAKFDVQSIPDLAFATGVALVAGLSAPNFLNRIQRKRIEKMLQDKHRESQEIPNKDI